MNPILNIMSRVKIEICLRSSGECITRYIDKHALKKVHYLDDLYTTESGEKPHIIIEGENDGIREDVKSRFG